MVNLFEPFVLSLLKNQSKPNPYRKQEFSTAASAPILLPGKKPAPIPSELTQKQDAVPIQFPDAKRSFFLDQKTAHWFDILRDQEGNSKDMGHHWNFLFPEIPWSEERLYWEDEKKKSKFFGLVTSKKDFFLFCVLFDSIRTGKVRIYLEFNPAEDKTSSVIFQTEREAMRRKIDRDKADLGSQLKILGKIRILVEANNDNLAKMTQNRLGLLA